MKLLKITLSIMTIMLLNISYANSNNIKIVSSFPAGSGPDALSRKFADQLSKELKVPVVIENKPGGNGIVALAYADSQKNSNNIILYASNDNLVSYPLLVNNHDMVKKFRPLKEAFQTKLVLAVGPAIADINDLKNSKTVSYGSWGEGSWPQLLGAELTTSLKIKNAVHVPYKDYGQWFSDVNSGIVTFSFVTTASTASLEKSGKLKYLGIAAAARDPQYPKLATLQELTGTNIVGVAWGGLYVPQSMSANREKELKSALDKAFNSPEVQESIVALNYSYKNSSTAVFKQDINRDQKNVKDFFEKYNIKLN